MASVEDRFQAAVNVIKNLPKNGPYQPSTGMMLKFYGYYKQATEGPCHQKKPSFWDIVGKAKWDAWNSNRHLTKQQAMAKYVEDLREIIETMSFTENVQDFVGKVSGLENIDLNELDMIAPGMREMAESHPDSPFNSRTNSPQHGASSNGMATEQEEESVAIIKPTPKGHGTAHMNGLTNGEINTESSIATPTPRQLATEATPNVAASSYATSNGTVDQSDDEYGDPGDMQHDFTEAMLHNSELLKQIRVTVLRMNSDIATMNQRISLLEKTVQDVHLAVQKTPSKHALNAVATNRAARAYPKWWPFQDISPAWFMLLLLWPFLVKRLSRMLITQRRK